MKKLTKISLAAVVALVLFTGCEEQHVQRTERTSVDINMGVNVYCDKDKDIEYLIFKGYKSGGMTPRYNADGFISRCSNK